MHTIHNVVDEVVIKENLLYVAVDNVFYYKSVKSNCNLTMHIKKNLKTIYNHWLSNCSFGTMS